MSQREAEDYVCGPTMLAELQVCWGLRATEQGANPPHYEVRELDAAIDRKRESAEADAIRALEYFESRVQARTS
jgi:hypothetical protein